MGKKRKEKKRKEKKRKEKKAYLGVCSAKKHSKDKHAQFRCSEDSTDAVRELTHVRKQRINTICYLHTIIVYPQHMEVLCEATAATDWKYSVDGRKVSSTKQGTAEYKPEEP